MKENKYQNTHPEENDALWNLLKEASPKKASPVFTQNVLREARLSTNEKNSPLKRFFKISIFVSSAALAVLLIGLISFNTLLPDQDISISQVTTGNTTAEDALSTWIDDTLLTAAIEDPELFSEEEIVAMIF